MKPVFIPSPAPPEDDSKPSWWFVFKGDSLLVSALSGGLPLPFSARGGRPASDFVPSARFIGTLDSIPCYAAEAPDAFHPPEGMSFRGLRSLFNDFGEDFFRIAGTARQLVTWDRIHRFCGACGALNEHGATERVKTCPRCGLMQFPRISPAVIVAVVRGDQILLARGARFRDPSVFSVLAGFAEVGETLEECVSREISEEVGITVSNITYFASQPWPFPHSLMVGFTAEWESGEIAADGEEILEAGWFSVKNMPKIPEKPSVARRLIDWFIFLKTGMMEE